MSDNAGFSPSATVAEKIKETVADNSSPITANKTKGLSFIRMFSREGVHPFDEIAWELREAVITNEKGEVVFSQKEVEVPSFWSQSATNIVVSKYFRGRLGTAERETSVRQMVTRVAKTMADWGKKDGYFKTEIDAQVFEMELTSMLVNQMYAFNSPVWFNVGVVERPQCSACFINSVQDDMRSILNLAVTEGMLFKGGSGTGTNFSTLRSSKEYLGNSSGKSSGPVSFLRGFDAFAGVIKSGGKTRRAAKMVIMDIDHPDIPEFINSKANEEKKAWALIDAGYDGSFNGEAYGSVFFQNANHSVRLTDEFMSAVEKNGKWQTHYVTTKEVCETYEARDLMNQIAEAAHLCGDPGLQFDTTINDWHTCSNTERIYASNPCSEYMFLNDSACNLSSINLMKFRTETNDLDVPRFKQAVDIATTAMEIVVGNSSYPTPMIEQNSHDFRPLGLGYANLGAFLMVRGLAYDSDEGRNFTGAITALMTGEGYVQSAKISQEVGSFKYFHFNEKPFLRVIGKHRRAAYQLQPKGTSSALLNEAHRVWDEAEELGSKFGFRNAQISVLAPTGTIAFLMDCDTTGIEPDIALVKYKWLVGGGLMKIVNNSVAEALHTLGYNAAQVQAILKYIDEKDTIEGAPELKAEHLTVFDCAFKPKNGSRSIHYLGHIRMMAAAQPFLSGAISKTVNMPTDVTVDDIKEAYLLAWKYGLKAIAVYRDGCKRTQPLVTSLDKHKDDKTVMATVIKPARHRMPDERQAITHSFTIGNHKGYISAGLYEDGTLGEIFIRMSKEGSTISGLMDAMATITSISLQYGVPLKVLVNKMAHVRFEPSGFTSNENIRIAKSIVDYIFRWLAYKFLPPEDLAFIGLNNLSNDLSALEENKSGVAVADLLKKKELLKEEEGKTYEQTVLNLDAMHSTFDTQSDAPACDTCGAIMVRNAACYKCLNCGATSGCS
ncbi:MAG: vitamin B12-dependent ribonucleotide reductase [Candidatus Komeilibacteria bacterium]|nr:vitamin B12-dependent ribonucleotide reductase [Candidatus Komeilibacteria bacterium]